MEQNLKLPKFFSFIASPAGRWFRVVAGLGIIGYGLSRKEKAGLVIASLGVIPFAAGAGDICLLGPMFGGSFSGDQIRQSLHQQQGHAE